MNANDIVKDTQKILSEYYEDWSPKWFSYAKGIKENNEMIPIARKLFNEWYPLRIYMPINQAIDKKACLFSIRYMGKDIGHLKVGKDDRAKLSLMSVDHAKRNREKMGLYIPSGEYDWVDSSEAKTFRSHFTCGINNKKDDEHKYESLILDEMELQNRTKFMGKMDGVQPVKLFNQMRFQMKVPLSANEGRPKYSKFGGAIDILARIGKGRGTNPAVIELKKEGRASYKSAIAQSIIYSTCILALLRDKRMGDIWFEVFGYKRAIPTTINIHSIAMVPITSRNKYFEERKMLELDSENIIEAGQDFIKCGYIFFSKHTDDNRKERIIIDEKSI